MPGRRRPAVGVTVTPRDALARAVRAIGRVRFDEDDGTWGFEAPEWLEGGSTEDLRWIPCGSQRQGFALRREYLARHSFRAIIGADFSGSWRLPEARSTPEALLYRMLREHVRTHDTRDGRPRGGPL